MGRDAVKPILPYDEMMKWKSEVGRDLDELRGDRKNRALDQEDPTQEEELTA